MRPPGGAKESRPTRLILRLLLCVPLVASAVGGCAATSPTAPASTVSAAVQQAASDVQLLATGLAALTPLLTSLGVPAATVTKIQGYISQVQTDAGQVSTLVAAGTTPDVGTVQDIAKLVGSIAQAAQGALPASPSTEAAIAIVQAAVSLAPVILSAFGVTAAAAAAPPLPAPFYSPDDARAILRRAAGS
jgi:hypothetical protein